VTPLLFGVAAFVIAQFAIAAWVARRIATEDDYLIAGRRMGPVLVTGSLFATWFGAETVVGAAALAHDDGISIANAEPFAYGLCIVIMGLVFARPLWNRKLTTLADLYRERYGRGVERLAAVVLIPGSVLWAAAQVRAFGQVIVVSGTGIELEVALAVATGFVILYSALGGMLADAMTDVLQAGVLIVGLVVVLAGVVAAVGGVGEAAAIVAASESVRLVPEGGVGVLATLEEWAIPVFGSVVAAELVTRVIAARSPQVARFGSLGAGALYLSVGMLPLLIGLLAGDLVGPLAHSEQVVAEAARLTLPWWLYVIFAGGFLAAILSTVDSTLLVSAGLVSHNLVLPFAGDVSERVRVRVNRSAVAVLGVVAYLLARGAEGVFALVEEASAFGSAGILVTVCFALFTTFGGARAAAATLVAGLTVYLGAGAMGLETPYLLSLAASVATYVGVGWVEGKAG
jgi:SSS family solute:Na+ symporter